MAKCIVSEAQPCDEVDHVFSFPIEVACFHRAEFLPLGGVQQSSRDLFAAWRGNYAAKESITTEHRPRARQVLAAVTGATASIKPSRGLRAE